MLSNFPLESPADKLDRLIKMAFGPVFGRTLRATFDPRAAVAAGWWLSGGIAAANCIAAYQPKGAASQAASYTNLANPGTYDAIDDGGGASPTWDATNGWKGTGGAGTAGYQYLRTTIIPNADVTWSFIVRVTSIVSNSRYWFGSYNSTGGLRAFTIRARVDNKIDWANGGLLAGTGTSDGDLVAGIAGAKLFIDGSQVTGTIPSGSAISALALAAFGLNINGTYYGYSYNLQAEAIYNTTISDAQMLAVSTAMNAL